MFDDDGYKSHEEIRTMPIYQKALEIIEITQGIVAVVESNIETSGVHAEIEAEMIEQCLEHLMENAHLIPVKIAVLKVAISIA